MEAANSTLVKRLGVLMVEGAHRDTNKSAQNLRNHVFSCIIPNLFPDFLYFHVFSIVYCGCVDLFLLNGRDERKRRLLRSKADLNEQLMNTLKHWDDNHCAVLCLT